MSYEPPGYIPGYHMPGGSLMPIAAFLEDQRRRNDTWVYPTGPTLYSRCQLHGTFEPCSCNDPELRKAELLEAEAKRTAIKAKRAAIEARHAVLPVLSPNELTDFLLGRIVEAQDVAVAPEDVVERRLGPIASKAVAAALLANGWPQPLKLAGKFGLTRARYWVFSRPSQKLRKRITDLPDGDCMILLADGAVTFGNFRLMHLPPTRFFSHFQDRLKASDLRPDQLAVVVYALSVWNESKP